MWAVTASGGDDEKDKKPVVAKTDDPKPSGSKGGAPVNPGDGSGDGGEDPEDLNEGRQAGEAKVLWYKEAPDAPGSGADADGMWITGKAAVKAAYKQVFAYNVGDGKPAWDPIALPGEDLLGHPREDGRRQDRRRLHERFQRPRQVQQVPGDRPRHRRQGLVRGGRRR
ncbi:hypothetical protein SVIOM342S_02148 [Streptomyces violaceorubidus]